MERYSLLCKVNQKIIFGESISEELKHKIVTILLEGIDKREDVLRYKKTNRVGSSNIDMYPDFYIPPYNNKKKLRLIQGYLPKTNILYSNHFELEILRLLILFDKEDEAVKHMVNQCTARISRTCFGNSCTQGECLATGISVLRFLASMNHEYDDWITRLLMPLSEVFLAFGNGQSSIQQGVPLSYLLMALTDINNENCKELISRKKDWLLDLLRRGWITGKLSNGKISEGDTYNLLGKYIIRNALGILPEYQEINQCEIYINEDDNWCYCNI